MYTARSAVADVGYVPGPLTAVAGESCLALVEAAPDSPAAAWIWQQAGQGASAQALLAGLLGAGFDGVGGFALLDRPAAGPLRLFCRGAVAATVVGGTAVGGTVVGRTWVVGTGVGGTAPEGTGAAVTATARIDGVGLLTWREHVVAADAERIYLGQQPDDGAVWLPAAAGVLLAGSVIVDLAQTDSPGAGGNGAGSAGSAFEAAPDAGGAVAAPAQPEATEVADPDPSADAVADVPDPSADAVAGVPDPPASDGWFQPSGISRDSAAPSFAPSSAPETDAPPPIVGPWEPPSGSSNGQWATPPLDGEPNPTAAPPGPEGGDGLIDPVSWGAGPGAPAAPLPQRKPALVVAPPPAPGPEEDGLTVKRADPAPQPESPPDRIGPDVPALICPTGHVNPPSEAACRQCGAALPPDPVMVARPLLGVLRLSTGDVLTLDRDLVLGRNPPADVAGANGEDRPHAVRLPSADGVISRSHLRVTLTGWHVLVTDLNSTNGTRVTMPGRDPEQLPPGVPVPIRPGTVVALAEGVDFRYEVP